jgi:hypothetical protein
MFVQPRELEDILRYIAKQEKTHKFWKKVCYGWSMLSFN